MLFYRITHLSRGKQYHIWAAAVTTAGRGNMSSKVIVEPAGKGGSCRPARGGGKAEGISLKVTGGCRAKDDYKMATWSSPHRPLSSLVPSCSVCSVCSLSLSLSLLLIDSHSIDRAATVLQGNAVVNYVLMNRAYPVKWPLGGEVAGRGSIEGRIYGEKIEWKVRGVREGQRLNSTLLLLFFPFLYNKQRRRPGHLATAQRTGFYFHKLYLCVVLTAFCVCVCSPGQDPVFWWHSNHTMDEGGPFALQLRGRTGTHN